MATTATTTGSTRSMSLSSTSGAKGKVAAGGELAAAFLLGALLIAWGAPRLAATIPVLDRALGVSAGTPDALKAKGHRETVLALAAATAPDAAGGLRAAAREALRGGPAAAPADPVAWYDLARLERAEHGATTAMVRPLRLSLMTGPREPG